ncbi:MAG: trigger factor [Solirubrobacterales bacterium]
MKTKLERIQKNEVALEIEVDADQLEAALQKSFRKVSARVNIPGFRKGKAPRTVVEAFVGRETLINEALEEVIPVAYEQAVTETEIEPVADPRIELVQAEDGKPLVFKANVVVKPEVKLGDVDHISVEVTKTAAAEADVDARLDVMRNRYARVVKAEPDVAAENGDVAVIDFEGFLDDVAFEGGTGSDYSLELGSNTFIPGFEEQLIGAVTGEARDVNVTFPEDYHSEDLAGKPVRFAVTIKEIRKRELNPLDDDFAKDVSEFDTLDELKADIRKNIEEMTEQQNKQAIREAVLTKAGEEAEIEIPQVMIDNQIEVLINRMSQRLSGQGIDLQTYLSITGGTMEAMRESVAPQALQVVRDNLVLEQVAKEKELTVTDEDFENEIQRAAAEMQMSPEDIRASLGDSRERLEQALLIDKAIEYLISHATITVKE